MAHQQGAKSPAPGVFSSPVAARDRGRAGQCEIPGDEVGRAVGHRAGRRASCRAEALDERFLDQPTPEELLAGADDSDEHCRNETLRRQRAQLVDVLDILLSRGHDVAGQAVAGLKDGVEPEGRKRAGKHIAPARNLASKLGAHSQGVETERARAHGHARPEVPAPAAEDEGPYGDRSGESEQRPSQQRAQWTYRAMKSPATSKIPKYMCSRAVLRSIIDSARTWPLAPSSEARSTQA